METGRAKVARTLLWDKGPSGPVTLEKAGLPLLSFPECVGAVGHSINLKIEDLVSITGVTFSESREQFLGDENSGESRKCLTKVRQYFGINKDPNFLPYYARLFNQQLVGYPE